MSVSVELQGEDGRIEIGVVRYENPNAIDLDDSNWLSCNVSVKISGFRAVFAANFVTSDFAYFRTELAEALAGPSGGASFSTYEEALRVDVEFLPTGRARISGIAQIFGRPKAALSFSFDSDQSFLAGTLRALDAAVSAFPIRK